LLDDALTVMSSTLSVTTVAVYDPTKPLTLTLRCRPRLFRAASATGRLCAMA
jgi:hypothetical protein